MSVQNNADARKDVNTRRILALLDAGKIGSIDTGEDGQISGLHFLGFSEFLDALADALSLSLTVPVADTH